MSSRQMQAHALRVLSMDAVQAANSGHPGAPLGMADFAQVLWGEVLKHNPKNPTWSNRDRFILSNGHASMLLYALLYLTGYDISIADLRAFRQLHSKTPGHPEYGMTPGVEATTGPLGQGFANAVGFALAEMHMAARFNRPEFKIVDHYTYVFMGDGCLMEGITHEAASFAGTQRLGKLIAFWDDNGISIDGSTQGWFTEDVALRFQAYGWQVQAVDGHDAVAVAAAIQAAKADLTRPSLIACKTIIGFGAPTLQGSEKCHGAPLGPEEIEKARAVFNWPYAPFEIPEEVKAAWSGIEKGQAVNAAWDELFAVYAKTHPVLAAEFIERQQGRLPKTVHAEFEAWMATLAAKPAKMATRKASLVCLNFLGPRVPALLGGSADLTHSNLTLFEGATGCTPLDHSGQYISYGVREFGMSAIANGLALYGGIIPYVGTFLTFVDYARNAVRLAALMRVRTIFVLTHDSIGLGEDGPTHQPIEHLAGLRAMPGLQVWRPADVVETALAWWSALQYQGPTCLILSRQDIPVCMPQADVSDRRKGAYIVWDSAPTVALVLIATGSELPLALQVAERLASKIAVRVVSMPCMEIFSQQSTEYQEQVLPVQTHRVAIEAAASMSWYRWTGLEGLVIGLDRFGESAPGAAVYQALGFTESAIYQKICTHFKINEE